MSSFRLGACLEEAYQAFPKRYVFMHHSYAYMYIYIYIYIPGYVAARNPTQACPEMHICT